MVFIYRGVAKIGEDGRAEIRLPNYFDALNQNPMIQLTGVGTSDVYIVENVKNNCFTIGGKSGAEVHWIVTGERKDPSAEITKTLIPIEQLKDGNLANRSLDDDFLCSTKMQLEHIGKANQFQFRTDQGRKRYEDMKMQFFEKKKKR